MLFSKTSAACTVGCREYTLSCKIDAEAGKNNIPQPGKARGLDVMNPTNHVDPILALAYNNRGNTYNALGQDQRAIQDYDQAIQLDPQNTPAYYNRGLAYQSLGEDEKAISDFRKVLEIHHDPDAIEKLRELGVEP